MPLPSTSGRSSRDPRPSGSSTSRCDEVMRRLTAQRPGRRARRRSGSPTSARGAARSPSRSPSPCAARRCRRRGHGRWRRTSRRTRSTSPARTRSATPSADRVRFVEADLLPPSRDEPCDLVAREPAVRPRRRDGRRCRSPPLRAGAGARRRPDGLAVIGRLLERLPDGALAADGEALLEIGADQGEAIGEAVAEVLPGWSVPRRAGPRRLAARRGRAAGGPRGLMDIPSNLPARVEPAFPIRLIALDIDGTLVGDDLTIGPRTTRGGARGDGARRRRLARDRPDGRRARCGSPATSG